MYVCITIIISNNIILMIIIMIMRLPRQRGHERALAARGAWCPYRPAKLPCGGFPIQVPRRGLPNLFARSI